MRIPVRCPFTGKFLAEDAGTTLIIKCKGCKGKEHSFVRDNDSNTYHLIDMAKSPV